MWTHQGLINGVSYLAAKAGQLWLVCLRANAATAKNVQFVAESRFDSLEPIQEAI
jgi:hypothetical protein